MESDVDHGILNICVSEQSNLEDIYPELSQGLLDLINADLTQKDYLLNTTNDCGCPFSEYVSVNVLNDLDLPAIDLELCTKDLPYDFNGLIIEEGDNYWFDTIRL